MKLEKNKGLIKIIVVEIILLSVYYYVFVNSFGEYDLESPFIAIFVELFVSLHMSAFFLYPLAKFLAMKIYENEKIIFAYLITVRMIILLIFDFFINPGVLLPDFFLVFIGAFLIMPILASVKTINKTTTSVVTTNNNGVNNTVTMVSNSNVNNTGDNVNNVNSTNTITVEKKFLNFNERRKILDKFLPIYKLSDREFIESYISSQMDKVGLIDDGKREAGKLLPKELVKRKYVLSVIFAILFFVFIALIFFHFPIYVYLIGLVLLIVFYKSMKKYNLIKVVVKQVKARPNEKITNVLMSIKENLKVDNSDRMLKIMLSVICVVSIGLFLTPKILYEKMDNGYGVRFYLFGITNFTKASIPDTYKGEKVVSLRGNTFSNMFFLKKVELPDTIVEIRGQAFKNNLFLKEVDLPKKLEYLGGGAFYNCHSLQKISIPDTVDYLGGESFKNAKRLESIKLSENITEIRGNTFENCRSLRQIVIPDKVERIGGHAFYGCSSLKSVTLTEESMLNEIGSSAFRLCYSLDDITIPRNTYVNERAFKESPTQVHYFGVENNYYNNYYGNDYNYNSYYNDYSNSYNNYNSNNNSY